MKLLPLIIFIVFLSTGFLTPSQDAFGKYFLASMSVDPILIGIGLFIRITKQSWLSIVIYAGALILKFICLFLQLNRAEANSGIISGANSIILPVLLLCLLVYLPLNIMGACLGIFLKYRKDKKNEMPEPETRRG